MYVIPGKNTLVDNEMGLPNLYMEHARHAGG
jgi:hypothetical protein